MTQIARVLRGRYALTLLFACILLLFGMASFPHSAQADEGAFGDQSSEVERDTAGNLTMTGDSASLAQDVDRDAYLAGLNVTVDGVSAGGDIIAAGRTVQVAKSQAGGDVRLAGSTLHVSSTQIDGNFTAAGNYVDFDEGSQAAAVYAFGNYVDLKGNASYAALSGQQVFIDGEIDGDVHVAASSVRIGENAKISGTLTVVGAQPDVAEGAQVGSMDVQLADSQGGPQRLYDSLVSAIVLLLTMIVTIAAIWWLAPGAAQDSLFMLQARKVPMLVSGAVALLAAPIAVAILLASGIGMLLAVVLVCVVISLAFLGLPFMCAAIARRIMRGSREWAVVGMAAAIAGLLLSLPVISVIAVLCGGVYIAGYVLQLLFLKVQARSSVRQSQIP